MVYVFACFSNMLPQCASPPVAEANYRRVGAGMAANYANSYQGLMHYERMPRFRRLKLSVALAALQTQDGNVGF